MKIKKNIFYAFSLISLGIVAISSYFFTNPTHVQHKVNNDIMKVQAANINVNVDEDEFKLERETVSKVVDEKIAMFPEYIFENTDEDMYLLRDTPLKSTPYEDGENIETVPMYEKVKITGKNNFDYWQTEVDGETYYIRAKDLTTDMRYIFTPTEETKYAIGDVTIKDAPSDEGIDLIYLSKNDDLTLIGVNDNQYYKVQKGYTIGYINKDFLMDNKNGIVIKEDGIYTVHNQEELELIWAIVQQECGSSYEGALAVITSAANRCNSPRWSYEGDTIYKQLTAPGQYCYSIDNYWQRWLSGNVNQCVKDAVADALNGKTNHNFTCFRSTNGGDPTRVNIGGNWYFGN